MQPSPGPPGSSRGEQLPQFGVACFFCTSVTSGNFQEIKQTQTKAVIAIPYICVYNLQSDFADSGYR